MQGFRRATLGWVYPSAILQGCRLEQGSGPNLTPPLSLPPRPGPQTPAGPDALWELPCGTESSRASAPPVPSATYLPLIYSLRGQRELLHEQRVQHLEPPAELREPHVVSVACRVGAEEHGVQVRRPARGPGHSGSPALLPAGLVACCVDSLLRGLRFPIC